MSPDRYNERACNTGECICDEICIAKQDLVIAIDGTDIRASILTMLFGNGAVLADGTVSGPTRVAKITDDLASVKTKMVVASQVY